MAKQLFYLAKKANTTFNNYVMKKVKISLFLINTPWRRMG